MCKASCFKQHLLSLRLEPTHHFACVPTDATGIQEHFPQVCITIRLENVVGVAIGNGRLIRRPACVPNNATGVQAAL